MNRREPDVEVDELARAVIGAAIEVHRELGPGFVESVYEHALMAELELRRIPFAHQAPFNVIYKGRCVGVGRMDLVIGGVLIVELKAVEQIARIHQVQTKNYLKATGLQLALLINFNVPVLKDGIQRIVLTT